MFECDAKGAHATENSQQHCDIGSIRAACSQRLQKIIAEHPSVATRNQARKEISKRTDGVADQLLIANSQLRAAADRLYEVDMEDARGRQLDRIANSVIRVRAAVIASADEKFETVVTRVQPLSDDAAFMLCSVCDLPVEVSVDEDVADISKFDEHMVEKHGYERT